MEDAIRPVGARRLLRRSADIMKPGILVLDDPNDTERLYDEKAEIMRNEYTVAPFLLCGST